jgi:predicted SnoaL-like aldol condensation-catalyzing enzyme
MTKTTPEQNKELVLKALDTLFNKRDYAEAETYWSNYIQHSALVAPGREGLFNLVKGLPEGGRYTNHLTLGEGDWVITHGRYTGTGRPANWIAADVFRIEDGKLAEHWDVLQEEVTKAESVSGRPVRRPVPRRGLAGLVEAQGAGTSTATGIWASISTSQRGSIEGRTRRHDVEERTE